YCPSGRADHSLRHLQPLLSRRQGSAAARAAGDAGGESGTGMTNTPDAPPPPEQPPLPPAAEPSRAEKGCAFVASMAGGLLLFIVGGMAVLGIPRRDNALGI